MSMELFWKNYLQLTLVEYENTSQFFTFSRDITLLPPTESVGMETFAVKTENTDNALLIITSTDINNMSEVCWFALLLVIELSSYVS